MFAEQVNLQRGPDNLIDKEVGFLIKKKRIFYQFGGFLIWKMRDFSSERWGISHLQDEGFLIWKFWYFWSGRWTIWQNNVGFLIKRIYKGLLIINLWDFWLERCGISDHWDDPSGRNVHLVFLVNEPQFQPLGNIMVIIGTAICYYIVYLPIAMHCLPITCKYIALYERYGDRQSRLD